MPVDKRHLLQGRVIPTEGYSDQPYVVRTDDGAWLCCVTTGPGQEGAAGQHVVTRRSIDRGYRWSKSVPVEPEDSPENSYAVMLKVPVLSVSEGRDTTGKNPAGRIYIFYNHNTDNVRKVLRHDGKGSFSRVDSLGYYVFRYSDDHGKSWSTNRYTVPVREFACDRENVYRGRLRFFWNVGRPFIYDKVVYIPLHKVCRMGEGFFSQSEGVLLKSDNLLIETEPAKVRWETLPDGDIGLRTPPGGGPVSEEQSCCTLSDGSFYCVYRSVDGHPVETYSRDGGHTWTTPRWKRYPDGRLLKNPRAANFVWRCSNGRYLYWFHNHGGRFIREGRSNPYDDRNPAWLCAGEETETPEGKEIRWSQPEIVLYDDDPYVGISYPDLVEEDGVFFLTETQKNIARVHEIDPLLVGGLWRQFTAADVTRDELLVELPQGNSLPSEIEAPLLPVFNERDCERADHGTKNLRSGFTIDVWLSPADLSAGQVLLDGRTSAGQGLALLTASHGTVELVLNDGCTENRWGCDPGLLIPGQRHHLVFIVDGGPRLIIVMVDGMLNDGGEHRQFGWGRFSPNLRHANGAATWSISPHINSLRVYGRALRTSEVIANFRASLRTGTGPSQV